MSKAFDPALLEALGEAMQKAAEVKGDPRRFAAYRDRPVAFARDILGVELWGKQKDILKAIVANRRTSCRSGHGTGKTFVAAVATIWWLYARQGLVVTTASTWGQIERVLWREIGNLWRNAKVPLPGQSFATELRVEPGWNAIGISVDNPTAFHGVHHPDLLVIIDEAPGVEDKVHDAIASLTTATGNRVFMIGNPTETSGRFYDTFERDIGWARIHISCLDHPNVVAGQEVYPGAVTREWVEERRMEYGEDSPLFAVRVLGEFPSSADNQLLPRSAVEAAMAKPQYGMTDSKDPIIMSVDVARYGSNRSVIAYRQGNRIVALESWQGKDTVETTGRVAEAYRQSPVEVSAIIVDETGVGGGVVDQLLAMGLPVIGFNAGSRSSQPDRFDNLRTEGWWRLREALVKGDLTLPRHEQLRRDLIAPVYSFSATGKIRAERKDQMQRRGIDSPDFADAVMMAMAMEVVAPEMMEVTVKMWDTTRDPAIIGRGMSQQEDADLIDGGLPSHWF